MKFICLLLTAILTFNYTDTLASDGYTININVKDKQLFSTQLYLYYYYGDGNTFLIKDSAKIDLNGKAKFESTEKEIGGMFMFYSFKYNQRMEFILNNGDLLNFSVNFSKYPFDTQVSNSQENLQFLEYTQYNKTKQALLESERLSYQKSKNTNDSLLHEKNYASLSKDLQDYRNNIIKNYPNNYLAKLFNAMKTPEINPNPKSHQDSVVNYENYKTHFWDLVDLNDDRIVISPIFGDKVKIYITLIDHANFQKDVDLFLSKFNNTNLSYAYSLKLLIRQTEINSYLYSGYYDNYVYIVNKYVRKLTNKYISEDLKKQLIKKSDNLESKTETSGFITNVICTKSEVETARNAQRKGITIDQQIKEEQKLVELKKNIENGSFTGEHYYEYEYYKYTGHFLNGRPDGNGKWEKPDGSWYIGQFKNGVENGIGTLRQTDGFRYTGNFTDGVPNGKIKIEKWTLMGLAKNAWTAEYKMGKLISSEQTEDGMDKLFRPNTNTSSNEGSTTNTTSNNCEWKLVSKNNGNAEFENDKSGTKKMLYELKKEDVFSKTHYKISGTSYFGTEVKYFYNDGGDVITDGGKKLGVAFSLDEAIIMLLKYKFCN